jgi:hypothetical protein
MSLEDETNSAFEKCKKRFSDSPAYRYAVDTAANVVYSLTVMSAVEYLALGLEPKQVLKSRLAGTLSNIVTGRPYGMYRDFVFRKMGVTEESSSVRKYAADLIVFNSFCIPLYSGVLGFAEADAYQMLGGIAMIAAMSLFIGRTLGWWVDRVRKWCGVRTAYDITNDS